MAGSLKTTFFTFVWKIENFSLNVMGQKIYFRSPSFKIHKAECEVIMLLDVPEGAICFEIQNVEDIHRLYFLECELSFHPAGDEDEFTQRDCLYGLKKDLHLPQDTLTVYCRIPQYPEIPSSQHLARTIFLRETFLWKIENFSDSQEIFTSTFHTDSLYFDIQLHKSDSTRRRDFSSSIERNYEVTVKQTEGERVRSANYEVAIMAADKTLFCTSGVEDIKSESVGNLWSIDLNVKNESELDSLTIQCEFTFEVNKMSSEEPQAVSVGSFCSRSAMIRNLLERNIPLIYYGEEQKLLDKILEYFPTDSVGELQLEWAAKLHGLADKFNLVCLKEKCLSISNVCKALSLADSREDDDFMRSVLDYICDHDDVIFSNEWMGLEKENPRLTTQVFREMYLRKVKNVDALNAKSEAQIIY